MARPTSERTGQQVRRDHSQPKGHGELLGARGIDRQVGLRASQDHEKPSSKWAVALQQVRDPVNILLIVVTVICIVGLLIALRAILGTG